MTSKRFISNLFFAGFITIFFSACAPTSPHPIEWVQNEEEESQSIIHINTLHFGHWPKDFNASSAIMLTAAAKICQENNYNYFSYAPETNIPFVLTNIHDLENFCDPKGTKRPEWNQLNMKCLSFEYRSLTIKGYTERPFNMPTFSVNEVLQDGEIKSISDQWLLKNFKDPTLTTRKTKYKW